MDSNVLGRTMVRLSGDNNINGVKKLLDKGVDINSIDDDGCTALYYASRNNCEKTVTMLLERGADVNICNMIRRTPLMVAASCERINIIKILLESEAIYVNTVDNRGKTALTLLPPWGSMDIIKLFLDYGADPYIPSDYRHTFFDSLEINRREEVKEYMVVISGIYIKGSE